MPQLPGGRHVAIHAKPLADLLGDANNPANVHKIMAIASHHDLEAYIEVIFLVPEAEAGDQVHASKFFDNSLPRPPGLVSFRSGYCISDWPVLTKDWSDPDKLAFREFLNVRGVAVYDDWLAQVRLAQESMRKSSEMTTNILAAWMAAGCHPAQEEGWAESDPGSTDWDSYDMLAALGQLAELLPNHPKKVVLLGNAHDRSQGMWQTFRTNYRVPPGWPEAGTDVRVCAEEARTAGWLENSPAEKQQWLHDQCIIECVNLWDAYGEGFMKDFPRQYGIIELVTLSPANACFER